jgi:hypothetical protein
MKAKKRATDERNKPPYQFPFSSFMGEREILFPTLSIVQKFCLLLAVFLSPFLV